MSTFTPLIALLLLYALLTLGCASANPVAPEAPVAEEVRVNLREQFTCETQPRTYCSEDGTSCWPEIDHYTQDTPCPAVPID